MRENGSPFTTLDNTQVAVRHLSAKSTRDALFLHIRRSFFAAMIVRAQTTEHSASRRRLLKRRRECRSREFSQNIRGQVRVNFIYVTCNRILFRVCWTLRKIFSELNQIVLVKIKRNFFMVIACLQKIDRL